LAKRELRDPIHGFIGRSNLEQRIIDTSVFQRLRRIRQLAMANLVYPGAIHSRFEHSIGAMHIAGRIADAIGLDREETELVRLAALLHDIGHGPFSHVSEPILKTFATEHIQSRLQSRQIHELLTQDIIRYDPELGSLISLVQRKHIIGVLEGERGPAVLNDLVSGPLDADKQDYLLRDSYFCGVRYGLYDLDRLTDTLAIRTDGIDKYLTITEDGIHALEQFIIAKYYMTTQVYRHRIRLITAAMIERGLRLGIECDDIEWLKKLFTYDGSESYIERFNGWTDDRLLNEILHENTPHGYAKDLFTRLSERRLFKCIATYRLSESEFEPLVRARLADLTLEDASALQQEIGKYLDKDPNHVVIRTFDIQSVREQSRNSEAPILVMTSEGPKEFEELSPLFVSIDAAAKVKYLEVYAPDAYEDDSEKARLRKKYSVDLRELIGQFVKHRLESERTRQNEA